MLGPARDIQEVRNAIAAYDVLPRWDPSNPQHLLEAIHAALRSEIGSEMSSEKGSELAAEIGATPGAAIDAVILRDLATEPTLSARRLAERLQLSQRAVEKHLAALQQKGRLLRHGSPRAGYWQVL